MAFRVQGVYRADGVDRVLAGSYRAFKDYLGVQLLASRICFVKCSGLSP